MTHRNQISYPLSLAINPEHQHKFNYPSNNALDTHTSNQYQNKKATNIPIQLSNTKIPKYQYYTVIPMQFINSQTTKLNKPGKNGKSILGQCEVYILNQPIHSDSITTLLTNYYLGSHLVLVIHTIYSYLDTFQCILDQLHNHNAKTEIQILST